MSQSYEQITLLDCNHKFSSEFEQGNTNDTSSNYTNKLGSGIHVEAGDQVSIHNSFISDVGATSDSIEFSDKRIETLSMTKTVLTYRTSINGSNDKPLGYERVSASNIASSVEVKQNSAKLLINYYKTANGENCFGLPRRYLVKDKTNSGQTWEATDNVTNGFAYRDGVLSSSAFREYNQGSLQFFFCSADKYFYVSPTPGNPDPSNPNNWFKVQNDNSRYKIFIAEETRYGQQTDNDLLPQILHYNKQTPADYEYYEYIEEIDINIETGFNSPSAIADTLTNTLRTSQSPQQNYFLDTADAAAPTFPTYKGNIPLSLELNSNTFKTFWASGIRLSNETIWTAWNNQTALNTGDAFDYVEDCFDAVGSALIFIENLNPDLFQNGIEGSGNLPPIPNQIEGGAKFVASGTGFGSTGGFNSLAEPSGTNNYMLFTGSNTRKWTTKNIQGTVFKDPKVRGKISIYYIQGNSTNGGENADTGEDLILNLLLDDGTVSASHTISSGSDNYVGSAFTYFEYTLTGIEENIIHQFQFEQTSSSQGTFDNYGIKYVRFESVGDPKDTKESNDYLSQYQYIGVKRPDLFIANRNFARFSQFGDVKRMTQGFFNLPTSIGGFPYKLYEDNFKNDLLIGGLNASGQPYHTIVFDLIWDDTFKQQDLLKDIFDAEGNYPELFRNEFNQMGSGDKPRTTVNNSKFIHMNLMCNTKRNASFININSLGWDYMTNKSGNLRPETVTDFPQSDLQSVPLFFDFQPEYKDNPNGGDSYEEGYKYGVFKKFSINGVNHVSVTTGHMFTSFPYIDAQQTSIPNCFFALNFGGAPFDSIASDTNFGADVHFNAYGNNIIGLTDGYLQKSYNASTSYEVNPLFENSTGNIRVCDYVNKIYLGADEPLFQYNNISGRFDLSQLHTAERVQNRYNADENYRKDGIIADFLTAGDKVYKINKRLYNNNFTPMIMPYSLNEYDISIPDSSAFDYDLFNLNPNVKAWTIFDQLTGIIIKDFGVSETNWDLGIWGILGFTYKQFNSKISEINNMNERVGGINKDALSGAMTNSVVSSPQMLDLPTNAFGSNTYTLQVPVAQIFNATYPNSASWIWDSEKVNSYPAITESAESVVLSAPNLPKKVRNGYFCIRSNIIDNWNYLGGQDSGEAYPILQVLPKINQTDDFFSGGESSISYTFTQPKTITEITTQICNPDQTLATLDNSSSVIYKITRFIPQNFNIVEQIMNEGKPKI